MNFTYLEEIVNLTRATNIDEECGQLRAIAKQHVAEDSFSLASSLFTAISEHLPMLVDFTYPVANPEDFNRARPQQYNDVLWLITLTAMQNEGITAETLAKSIDTWLALPVEQNLYTGVKWGNEESLRQACIMMEVLWSWGWVEKDGIEQVAWVDKAPRTYFTYPVAEKFKAMMQTLCEKAQEKASMKCQPLLHKPMNWTSNTHGVSQHANMRLVKGYNGKKIPQSRLNAVNKLQSTAFTIDEDVMQFARRVVSNPTQAQKWLKMDAPAGISNTETARINNKWKEHLSIWKSLSQLRTGVDYYFPVTADSRFRMYYRGGLAHPQANDGCKAAFQFSRALPLGVVNAKEQKTRDGIGGFMALCVSFCTALGIKASKLQKATMITQSLESGAFFEETKDMMTFVKKYANEEACQAWVLSKAIKAAWEHKQQYGTFQTFKTGVVCPQDGTCNGLQHISVITRDAITGAAVNVTAAKPWQLANDVYGIVVDNSTLDLIKEIGRGLTKGPVMTGGYGASDNTMIRHMKECVESHGKEWNPAVSQDIFATMERCIPALRTYVSNVQELAMRGLQAGLTEFTWRTFDGFYITQKYELKDHLTVRGGWYTAVRKGERKVNLSKMVTAFAPNITHGQDATHLVMTVDSCDWDLVTVHDQIGSHAVNYWGTNRKLRVCMHEMYNEYDIMAAVALGLNTYAPEFVGDYDVNELLQAENLFG